jgi:hypothetical protein
MKSSSSACFGELSLSLQDMPFTVVNTLFLLRTVQDFIDPKSSLCSARVAHNDEREECRKAAASQFTVMLLVLLSSMASLIYKLMRLLAFPEVWRESIRLQKERTELAERAHRLDTMAEMEIADAADHKNPKSDSDDEPHDQRGPHRQAASAAKVVVAVTTFEIGVFPECGR